MIVRSPFFGIVQLATSALGGATLAQAATDTGTQGMSPSGGMSHGSGMTHDGMTHDGVSPGTMAAPATGRDAMGHDAGTACGMAPDAVAPNTGGSN